MFKLVVNILGYWSEGCVYESQVHQAAPAGLLSKAFNPKLLSCINGWGCLPNALNVSSLSKGNLRSSFIYLFSLI